MILKEIIRYHNAPAIEATWVDENDMVVKCQAYSNHPDQIAQLRADLGADAAQYDDMIAEVAATYTAPPLPSDEEVAAVVAAKIEALWQAADKYVTKYISGVAVDILTVGVIQKLPKATTVSDWSSSIWAEYYRRKALITYTSDDDHDFTSFGPIPYTVPELQAEAGL